MNVMCVIKHISVKLQKKSNDIVAAYKMVSDVQKELAEMRSDEEAFQSSYRIAIETGLTV